MARTATRRQVATAPLSQTISAYTRVSKSQVVPDAAATLKKTTAAAAAAAVATKEVTTSIVTRKRKAAAAAAVHDDGESDLSRVAKRTVFFAPRSDEEPRTPVKRSRRGEPVEPITPVKTPRSKESKDIKDSKDSKDNREIKESKARKSTPKTTQPPSSAKKTPTKLTPSKSTHQSKLDKYNFTSRKADNGADLIRLHKAFLKTILLHIAHSGRNVPIDIASISPNISRNWGKRAITVDDIRRCVAIENSIQDPTKVSPFLISDYGRGKVCVELKHEWVRDNTTIYEERLCKQFEENIRQICIERAKDETCDILSSLPQAEIINKDSGIQANPLLAKGHHALSELKNNLAEKQQEKEAQKHVPAAVANAIVNSHSSKMSLLDRIRHKKLAKANEPLPPSGPELERRAALNRVNDVAAIISMFSLSNPSSTPRQAFTMTLILDKLRDSLRVPISRDEGTACIRLIAKEIAPEWVKIVIIGGRENVVIKTNARPVDRILADRVQKLLA